MAGEVVALETELPEGEQRSRLLQALARVIALRGHETFVRAPIVLPSPDYFPEPAERTLHGAGVLVLRLLRYARLHPLPVLLTGYRHRSRRVVDGISLHDPGLETAAWYAGVRDGVCQFGLELRALRDDSALVAALAHEVTHAYRDRHALAVRDRDAEEKLTDLTAVYLGFGVFLTNASLRVETGGYSDGGERLLFARHSLGYLSPAEFALLLAAQVVARGLDLRERRKIREALDPNHARLFELGVVEMESDAAALRHQLGVPEPEEWPPAWDIAVGELDFDELEIVEPAADVAAPASGGSIAFRVEQSQAMLFGVLTALVCFAISAVLELPGVAWVGMFALGPPLGALWGGKRRVDWCSSCRGRLHADDMACEKCGARLVGEIKTFDERLAAEETFRAAELKARKSAVGTAATARPRGSATGDLLDALYMAWILDRGLTHKKLCDAVTQVRADVRAGTIDVARLLAAWDERPQPFSKEGGEFTGYYVSNHRLRLRDHGILTTASKLRADTGSLRRLSAILDRRLEEWRGRGDGPPTHAL